MNQDARPRESATLVLMRQPAGAPYEVLLVERRAGSAAGGSFVFPGGLLEDEDHAPDALALLAGRHAEQAERRLGIPQARALGHFVAAVRETFEEAAILLARDRRERPFRPSPADTAAFGAARAAMREGSVSFNGWLCARGLRPAVEDIAYFSHWITPEGLPRRYDTRFFLAIADADVVAVPDGTEVVDCRWMAPAQALLARRSGRLPLVNATEKTLELLATFETAIEARDRLGSRAVSAIQPKLARQADGHRVVNPWEPGYDAL